MRSISVGFILVAILVVKSFPAFSQGCSSLPPILSLGSNKVPTGLCSPVTVDLNYSITFAAATPASLVGFQLHFEWGDGTPATIVGLATGQTTYTFTRSHSYPANSDCEYQVRMFLRANNVPCASTIQFQRIASWRTDEFNQGNVQLVSPVTNTNIHEVCEGEDISVVFDDLTNFNCNSQYPVNYTPGGPFIETPNEQDRWQQIVYNTPIAGTKIPNISVNGVPVTGAGGANIISNYQDPRGVFHMASPVVRDDPRRRDALEITAPGGFGAGFPQAGQELEVTIRYWNFCNPYDDPSIPGPPTDLINGDSPPVEATAIIRIVDSPNPPIVADRDICSGDSRTLTISNPNPIPGGFTARWFSNPTLTTEVATGQTFTPTNAQAPAGQATHFYVVIESNAAGNCRSDVEDVTLVRRPNLAAPTPGISMPDHPANPDDFCPDSEYRFRHPTAPANVTIADPSPAPDFSLATQYVWTVPTGWNIDAGQNTQIIETTSRNSAGSGNISVVRQYTSGPSCPSNPTTKAVNVRDAPTAAITPDPARLCEIDALQLDGNPTVPFGSILSHVWSGDNFILDDPLVQQPTVQAGTAPANYNLSYTVTAQFDPGVTCSGTDNITVTVNPTPPKPTITPSGATTFCFGGNVTLTSSNILANSYQWYRNGSAILGAINQTIVIDDVAESGIYTVRTIGVAPTNCNSPESDPVTVTVQPLPQVQNPTGGGAVCSGNSAPDIQWVITAGTPPFNITYSVTHDGGAIIPPVTVTGYIPTEATAPYTFVIANPNPPVDFGIATGSFDYQLTSVQDANGCSATSLGTFETVTIGGAAPIVDEAFSLISSATCHDGSSTVDPVLDFSIDQNNTGFTLFYRVNGSALRSKIFATDVSGDPTGVGTPITFSDTELDAVGNHTITIVSILSAAGCQTTVNAGLPYSVNPIPPDPVNPIGGVACSTDATGAMIRVDDPGANNLVLWFTDVSLATPAIGITSGTHQEIFTPASNATLIYYAVIQSQIGTTNCLSENAVAVDHIQDLPPTMANAGNPTEQTCDTQFILNANLPNAGLNETGYWTVSSAVYFESFSSADNGVGATGAGGGPIITLPSSGNWALNVSAGALQGGDWLRVQNGVMEGTDTDGEVVWESKPIDISTSGTVDVSLDIQEFGTMEASDYIRAFYEVDGGGFIPFINGDITDDNAIEGDDAVRSVSATGLTGSTLRIIVRMNNNAVGEFHRIDNVRVYPSGDGFPSISDVNDPLATVSNLQVGTNTLTWHIQSQYNVCPETSDNIIITRIALPLGVDVSANVCEDAEGTDESDNIDLTAYNSAVTGGAANRTVSWYTDAARTSAVADPTDVDNVTDGDVFYARITETSSGSLCENLVPGPGSVTFTIDALPVAIDISPELCENALGSNRVDNVDLTTFNDDVANGIVANRTVTWWLDPTGTVNHPSDLVTQIMTPADVDNINDGERFYAVIENTLTGCLNIALVEFIIHPLPQDNPISVPGGGTPATYTVCASATSALLFQVDATRNPGSTFTWSVPTGPGEFLHVLGGGINDELILLRFPNVIASPGLALQVTETSSEGCVGNTNTIMIIVDTSPPAPVIAGDDNVCVNEQDVHYNITAPVGGSTYTWTVPGTLGSIVTGQGTDEIVVNMSTTSGNISVVETNSTGCISPPASPLNVTVNPKPSMTSANTAEICSGEAVSTALHFTSDLDPATIFQWEVINKIGPVIGASVGNTGTGDITQVLTNSSAFLGQVVYEVTPMIDIDPSAGTEYCPGLPAQTVIVDVNPQPVGQNDAISTCSDVSLNYNLQTNNIDVFGNSLQSIFTYTVVSSDQVNVPAEADRVTPSNAPITHNYVNLTSSSVTITYTVIPYYDNGGAFNCEGNPFTLTVTVHPEPILTSVTNIVCSDVSLGMTLATAGGSVAASTFNITNIVTNGLTASAGAPVTGTGFSANVIADDTWTNTGTVPRNIEYTIVPVSAAGCVGEPATLTFTINPEPAGLPITRAAQCSDAAFSVSPDNIQNGIGGTSTYTWVRNPLPTGLVFVVAGTGTGPIAETLQNLTNGTLNATYTVTPASADGCEGNPYVITVPILPEPVGADITRSAECSNVSFSVNPDNIQNGMGATATYTWVRDALPTGLTEVIGGTGNGLIAETIENLTSNTLNATYVVTPHSAAGCAGNPYIITIPINPQPVGADITLAAQCSDVAFSLSPNNIQNGLGASSTFTWVRNVLPAGLTVISNGTGTGAIAETIQNLTGGTLDVTYTVTPHTTLGCDGDPYTITVPINPEPVGANITLAAQCSDVGFNVSPDNISNGLGATSSYAWTRNALPVGLTVVSMGTGTGNIAETLRNVTSGTLNVSYTVTPTSGNGCTGNTYVITIPINPEPVGSNITRTAQCSDVPFSLSPDNISNGLGGTSSYAWVRNTLPGGLTEVSAGTGTGMIAETLQNLTGLQLSATYVVTPRSSAGCDGNPYEVVVPINPEPVGADIARPAQCSDVPFSLSPDNISNGLGATSTYSWTRNILPAGLTVVTSGSGSGVIAETLRNLTNGQLIATYTVTPTSGTGCIGSTYQITVPINPEPVAPAITTIERCSGENINYDLQTIIDGAGGNALDSRFTFTVTASSLVGLSPLVFPGVFDRVTPSDAIITQAFTNLSNAPITITYTVIPFSDPAGCEGSPFELRVIVYPQPVGINFTEEICSNTSSQVNPLNHNIQATQVNVTGGNALVSVFTYTVSSSDEAAVPTPASLDRTTPSNLPITDDFVNISGANVTVTYLITPVRQAFPNCQGADFTYQVVVKPRPVGFDFDAAPVCSNTPFDIDPQNVINDTGNGGNSVVSNFTWTANYGTPGNLTVNGAAPPTTDTDLDGHVDGFLTNKTNGQKLAVYTITPTSSVGTCLGDNFEIRLPIDPQPVLDPSVINTPICSDTPFDFDLASAAGTVTHSNYDIEILSVHPDLIPDPGNRFFLPPGTPSIRNGENVTAIRNEQYTNKNRTIGLMVQYSVSAKSEITPGLVCQGENLLVQIEILPEPVMDPSLANPVVCSDVASDIQLETDGVSISATSFFVNSITLQSDGTTVLPGTTVGAVTSKASNANADPSISTGARGKMYLRSDAFTVVDDVAANARTVVYNVTPRSGAGCFGDPFDINLQILPEPQFDYVVPPPVCSDVSIDLELHQRVSPPAATNSIDIAQYNITGITWQPGLLPGGGNISIGQILTADANGNFIAVNDVYTNGTSASLTATYAIRPIAVATLGHSCEGDPVNAVVTIKPSPVVLSNLDKIVCNDVVNGITIGTEFASAAAQSYEIIRNSPPAGLTPGTYTPGTIIVNGATTTNISGDRLINSANNPVPYTYTVRANTDPDGVGCFGPAETITVTVEPQILASVTGVDQICSGNSTFVELSSPSTPSAGDVTFSFTASSAVPGAISGMAPGTNFNTGQDIEQLLSNSSNNPVNVTYTITPRANSAAGGNICIGPQSTFVVSVEPKPRLSMTPASLTVCEGVPLGVDFNSVTVPSTGAASLFFQLGSVEDPNTLAAPANVSGFVTTYPTNYATGTDVLNDVLVNSANDQQPLRYVFTPSFVIPSGETCTGDQVSLNVTVSPRPTLLPFTVDPKCSGEAFSMDYASFVTEADHASTLATWAFAYTPAGDPDLTGASNGAGFELSQVVFNKNPDPATVTYSIKARSFSCESNTIQVPVQVYPTPRVTGTPNSVNVCNGGMLSVPFNSTASNTLYTWIVDDESQPTLTGASDQPTPVAGPMSFTLNNTSTVLSNYTFEITPQVNTSLAGKVCVGDPFTLVANVSPPLNGRITTSNGTNESFICTGSREFLFLEFDGLPLFDVVYKEGTNINILTKQGAFKPIQVTPTATTVYELVSIKDAFGCTLNINETATVNVNNTDASFSVLGPPEACSPYKVSFQYDQQAGVNYTWKWFDGPDSTMYTAATSELAKIVKHTFENPSPVGVAKFKVYLESSLADPRYPGCMKSSFQEVRVSPNIGLGVFPNVTEICSGEAVSFTNSSQGASSHRWFYREQGTTQENDVRTTVSPTFQLVNNTTQNPIVYEVVYNADNGLCPASSVIPITVYRNVDAGFNEGTIPPFIGGSSTVTFTNTSVPIDPSEFSYAWTFGGSSTPEAFGGSDATIPVTYTLPGLKEVTLTVTNTVANTNGLTCSDVFSKTIEILLPPLVAAFNATPLAGCFPIDITIIDNMSTGDTFKWQVIDQSGNIAATAIAPNPVFRISNPGTYDIFLETSSSVTGQTAFAQKTGVEVFDRPLASIEARPTTLFVPDTELITFNFSTGANFYQWDFDDGTVTEEYEPRHFYQLEGTYQITLVAGYDHGERDIDGDGISDGNVFCYDTAKRDIIARQGGLTKIPNAFTPNPNGPSGGSDPGSGTFNDVFLPITKGVSKEEGAFVMQIYDRWGTLMFESRNQNLGWDGYDRNGNLVPAGVYVYKLDLRLVDGQRITQVGDVTVIR